MDARDLLREYYAVTGPESKDKDLECRLLILWCARTDSNGRPSGS
jgi:hypothetical protein